MGNCKHLNATLYEKIRSKGFIWVINGKPDNTQTFDEAEPYGYAAKCEDCGVHTGYKTSISKLPKWAQNYWNVYHNQ